MKKSFVLAAALLLSSHASAASMEFVMRADDNLAGVAMVRYIQGQYPSAAAPLGFFNPFKKVTSDYKSIVNAMVATYDKDKSGFLNEGDEYEAFMAGNQVEIEFADGNKDGAIDNSERRVLAGLIDDIEEFGAVKSGCDAANRLADVFSWQTVESVSSIGSVIPIWKKCKGLADGKPETVQ